MKLTAQEHRDIAEEQLTKAEAMFAEGNDPALSVSDAAYAEIAHLRQTAMVHAILSQDL